MKPASRVLTLFVIAVFVAVTFSGCVSRSEDNPHLKVFGDPAESGRKGWPGPFQGAITFYDIDGDGRDEIVAHSTDKSVYVYSSTGKTVAVLPTNYPPAWHIDQVSNGVSVDVLTPADPPSVIIADHAATISVWTFVPSESDEVSFTFEKRWDRRMTECKRNPSMDAGPTVVDLDGGGEKEILVHTEDAGLFALAADGKTLWHHCWSGGHSAPVAADLDGNGKMEAIFASDSGFISVFDGVSGSPLWTFNARDHIKPGSVPVSPTVADLDGRPPMEILFTARHAPRDDPDAFDSFSMGIFAIRQNMTTWKSELVWMTQPEWANPISYTRLAVHDVDGDERPDIFGMDWNTIGHRPGEWQRLGPGNVFRLTADGETVWKREIDAWWSNKGIAIGDVDGDGALDVLANGPKDGSDGFWRLSTETGKAEGFISLAPWKMTGGANLVDLDHDGTMEIVARVVHADAEKEGGILVYDLDAPADIVWRGDG